MHTTTGPSGAYALDVFFCHLMGPVAPFSIGTCPLGKVLTYKTSIYLLNLQVFTPQTFGLVRVCFHPWCLDGQAGSQAVGKSLSRLYLRNCKV